MHACDRRTDGQTDRILITIPRLHYMQRGKNENDHMQSMTGSGNNNRIRKFSSIQVVYYSRSYRVLEAASTD